MAPVTSPPGKLSWLHDEAKRAWVAVIPTMVITFTLSTVMGFTSRGDVWQTMWQATLWGWASFAAAHALLTWVAFRGRTGSDLAAAVGLEEQRRRRAKGLMSIGWVRWLAGSESAPSWSVQLSLMALVGTGALLVNSSLRTPLLMLSAALLVAASWVNVWMMFAVQYARMDLKHPGLVFAGEGERSFTDYLYLALSAQTTFGPGDVVISTSDLRRTMMTNSVVAFLFNSVILAVLVSLILSGR